MDSQIIVKPFCRILHHGDIIEDARASNDSSNMVHGTTKDPIKFSTVLLLPYVVFEPIRVNASDKDDQFLFCGPVLGILEAFVQYQGWPLQFIEPSEHTEDVIFQIQAKEAELGAIVAPYTDNVLMEMVDLTEWITMSEVMNVV